MPIKVQCACGAAFAAKDELAGRTVKCPKCQQPLAIPAAASAAPAAARQPAAPRPMSAPLPSQAAAPAGQSTGDLFDEMGMQAPQAGKIPCPGCATPMPVEAIICIKCGFNKRIGRRMETVKGVGSGPDIPGGHGVTVDELLSKAARTIDEDKEEERKKTSEGMPWWVYLIGITVVVGFMIGMMLIPQGTAMRVAGWTVIVLGWLVAMYSGIRLLIIAFQEGAIHGVLYILFWPYQIYFIIMHWDKCGGFFLMNLVAGFFMAGGFGAIVMAEVLENPEESSLHRRPVIQVVATERSLPKVQLS
jgi:hypothetical protein